MALEFGSIDINLASAAGNDPALLQELRAAFLESVDCQIDLLGRARCDGNWHVAAQRLKSIAAGFHARDLMVLADRALETAPGDPSILRAISAHLAEIRGNPEA